MKACLFLVAAAATMSITNADIAFNETFSSNMVLQQAPASARLYGTTTSTAVNVSTSDGDVYEATVENGLFSVVLPPTSAHKMEPYSFVATNTEGETVELKNVLFGDVWYCAGQSNMWLPMQVRNRYSSRLVAERPQLYCI